MHQGRQRQQSLQRRNRLGEVDPAAIRLERRVIFVELAERADRRQDRGAPAEALAEYAAKLARSASRRDEDGGVGQC